MTVDELLAVEISEQLTYAPGDFGAKVEDGRLLLPRRVYEVFATHEESDLGYAYEIICAFENRSYDFRADVVKELGWKREEVETAYEKLFRQTYHSIPESILRWTGKEEDARKLRESEKSEN